VGPFNDATACDSKGRKRSQWVAIDALYIPHDKVNDQFQKSSVLRELNKVI
jgi:hypothetical protein